MRGPVSQPVGVHTVMEILHEIGTHDDPMIALRVRLAGERDPRRRRRPVLPAERRRLPARPVVAAVGRLVAHPDRRQRRRAARARCTPRLAGRRDEFCWRWIDALDLRDAAPAPTRRFAVVVPGRRPDAARAEAALDALAPGPPVADRAATATSTAARPLAVPGVAQPPPVRPAARSSATSTRSRPRQRDDGGWTFGCPAWNPVAAHEWRGMLPCARCACLRRPNGAALTRSARRPRAARRRRPRRRGRAPAMPTKWKSLSSVPAVSESTLPTRRMRSMIDGRCDVLDAVDARLLHPLARIPRRM